jgi:threonine synthase
MQMLQVGVIDWNCRMLGVQAHDVAPIADAFASGKLHRGGEGNTYADSINVPVPRNWRKAVNAVRQSEGAFVTATDEQMMQAVRDTGRLAGIFAEPAAAAAVAAIGVARQQRLLNDHSDVLAMITGNGLKDIAGALKAVGKPHDIEPSLDAILKVANA